jgi:hypothetical protein
MKNQVLNLQIQFLIRQKTSQCFQKKFQRLWKAKAILTLYKSFSESLFKGDGIAQLVVCLLSFPKDHGSNLSRSFKMQSW